LSFNTPEEAYKFASGIDYTAIVYGDTSAYAVGIDKDDAFRPVLLIKDDEKWRFTFPNFGRQKALFYQDYVVYIIENNRVSDLYVEVFPMVTEGYDNTHIIMVNNKQAEAVIQTYDKNFNTYFYNFYYQIDQGATNIDLSIDGEIVKSYPLRGNE
jgi:hypothetical protein